MKRVLFLGASGLIGPYLIPGLVDRPFNLRAGAVSGSVGGSVGDRTSSGKVSSLFTRSKRLKKQPVSTGKTSGRFSKGN